VLLVVNEAQVFQPSGEVHPLRRPSIRELPQNGTPDVPDALAEDLLAIAEDPLQQPARLEVGPDVLSKATGVSLQRCQSMEALFSG